MSSVENSDDKLNYDMTKKELMKIAERKHLILPVYMYEHSGIALSTGSFSDNWDSGQVGWIYTSHKNIIKEYGSLTEETIQKARKALQNCKSLFAGFRFF